MPKICDFADRLEANNQFLKENQQVGKLQCSICISQFSKKHGGRSDILQHIKTIKDAITAENKNCSNYSIKETATYECKHIAAEESLFAPHTIKHKHRFPSMD
jgi:hypothetical protein